MEPDPSPDPTHFSSNPEITTADIKKIVGNSKKRKQKPLYIFSKRLVIIVASLAAFIFLLISHLSSKN